MDDMSTSPTEGLPTWTLADRLRKIRRDRGLTQEEIAHALGVTTVTWSAWEAGRNRPKDVVELAAAVERRYGVPAAWTLGVLQSFDRRQSDTPTPRAERRRWTDFSGASFA